MVEYENETEHSNYADTIDLVSVWLQASGKVPLLDKQEEKRLSKILFTYQSEIVILASLTKPFVQYLQDQIPKNEQEENKNKKKSRAKDVKQTKLIQTLIERVTDTRHKINGIRTHLGVLSAKQQAVIQAALDQFLNHSKGDEFNLMEYANSKDVIREILNINPESTSAKKVTGLNPSTFAAIHRRMTILMEKRHKAASHFAEANLRLVISVAKTHRNQGVPFLDLIQEGNIGLLRAVDKFDPRKNFKFSTYATYWIRQSITRFKDDNRGPVRCPIHVMDDIRKIHRVTEELCIKLQRDPSNEEIAEKTGIPLEKVEYFVTLNHSEVDLDKNFGEGDKLTLKDTIEDANAVSPSEEYTQNEMLKDVEEAMRSLGKREAYIIRLRFGLTEDKRPRTLEEVGLEMGVTRERVRQLETKALRILRHPVNSKKLQDHIS